MAAKTLVCLVLGQFFGHIGFNSKKKQPVELYFVWYRGINVEEVCSARVSSFLAGIFCVLRVHRTHIRHDLLPLHPGSLAVLCCQYVRLGAVCLAHRYGWLVHLPCLCSLALELNGLPLCSLICFVAPTPLKYVPFLFTCVDVSYLNCVKSIVYH